MLGYVLTLRMNAFVWKPAGEVIALLVKRKVISMKEYIDTVRNATKDPEKEAAVFDQLSRSQVFLFKGESVMF